MRTIQGRDLIVALTVITLAIGWLQTWPDLNRDFNHLHGWEHASTLQLARMFVQENPARTGYAPVAYKTFDAAGDYRYHTHYPAFPHLLLSLVSSATPREYDPLATRLAGMAVSAATLLALYLFSRKLFDPRFGAWVLFFAAVNAEIFFFGAFPRMNVLANLFVPLAYLAYLRWRSQTSWKWSAVWVACLVGAYLSWMGFYTAAAPILLDLVLFDPAKQGRRRWRRVAVVAVLPLLVFAAFQIHYRYGIAWLTGREVWASGVGANLPERTNWSQLLSPGFYGQLIRDSFRFVSPVGVVVLAFMLLWAGWTIGQHRRWMQRADSWKTTFVGASFALGVFLLVFPEWTKDHEFSYSQLVVPLSLAAALFVYRRGLAVKASSIALTTLMAFGSAGFFSARNNTPQHEFQMGIALRMATPDDSFVRVHLPGTQFYAMLLYYSDRNLLFDVPSRFRALGAQSRFEVVYYPKSVPSGTTAIFVPPSNGVILDYTPQERAELNGVRRSYETGAWTLNGAGVTGAFDDWRLVEIDWDSNRRTTDPLAIEIGEISGTTWSTLLRANLRGNTRDTSRLGAAQNRDGYLVRVRSRGRLALRVYDPFLGRYRYADNGALETPLLPVTGAT